MIITQSQNMEALDLANEMRFEAAAYKRECAAGRIAIEDALRNCELPMTLRQLLTAFDRVGMKRAEKWARKAKVPSLDIRMCGNPHAGRRAITPDERERLIRAVNGEESDVQPVLVIRPEHQPNLLPKLMEAGCSNNQVSIILGISRRQATIICERHIRKQFASAAA
jgi:hypothetical protein